LRDTMELRLRPFQFLAPLTIWWGERMTGLRLDDLRPVEAIASVSPRPILIMQAGDDQVVPPNSGQKLYSAAGRPKDLWLAPGVEHVNFRESLPEAYRERIIGFFERYLPLGGREKEPG
jgi:fermentation-respiration switch protein FrsA (DUF1100 family)